MKAWEEKPSTAEFSISTDGGRKPNKEHLKSAIGEAYYAVLHGLETMCANCFIGDENAPDTPDKAWLEAYRSLKHSVVPSACTHPEIERFPFRVQSLASSIGFLQNARHSIDHHPRTYVDLGIAWFCVSVAKECIESINELPKKDRIAFSAGSLLNGREVYQTQGNGLNQVTLTHYISNRIG